MAARWWCWRSSTTSTSTTTRPSCGRWAPSRSRAATSSCAAPATSWRRTGCSPRSAAGPSTSASRSATKASATLELLLDQALIGPPSIFQGFDPETLQPVFYGSGIQHPLGLLLLVLHRRPHQLLRLPAPGRRSELPLRDQRAGRRFPFRARHRLPDLGLRVQPGRRPRDRHPGRRHPDQRRRHRRDPGHAPLPGERSRPGLCSAKSNRRAATAPTPTTSSSRAGRSTSTASTTSTSGSTAFSWARPTTASTPGPACWPQYPGYPNALAPVVALQLGQQPAGRRPAPAAGLRHRRRAAFHHPARRAHLLRRQRAPLTSATRRRTKRGLRPPFFLFPLFLRLSPLSRRPAGGPGLPAGTRI